eukprot:1298350-Amphidinium_carterae.1
MIFVSTVWLDEAWKVLQRRLAHASPLRNGGSTPTPPQSHGLTRCFQEIARFSAVLVPFLGERCLGAWDWGGVGVDP